MYRTFLGRTWWAVLLVFLGASAAAGAFLPRFGVEAGTNVLLNEDDPDLDYYNRIKSQWGYDEYAIVCARRADWFTPESVKLLTELSDDLKKAVFVESTVSILTIPLLRNKPSLIPIPAFLSAPGMDLAKAKEELLSHELAQGNLISKDGRDINILVSLAVPEAVKRLEPEWTAAHGRRDKARIAEIEEDFHAAMDDLRVKRIAMMADLRRLAAGWSPKMDEPIRLSGLPVININLVEHVQADVETFGIISLAVFTAAFLAVYRKPRWTFLPILSCLLPVLLIVGTMAMLGRKVTVITSNLPVLLFTLMLPYTVYFVERYRERRTLFAGESTLDTSAGAGADIWTPCLYSCTTTMAGFASLLTSGINPVRVFGLMMTIGMGVGLACVFLFLPAATKPLSPSTGQPVENLAEPRGIVRLMQRAVHRAPLLIAVHSVALLGLSIWGTTRIKVETKFIDYFWPRSEVYQGLEYIDTRMGGTTPLEVMLTSPEPGFFLTPKGLESVEAVTRYFHRPELEKVVGNVRSLSKLVAEVRKHPTAKKFTVENLSKIDAAKKLIAESTTPDFATTRVEVRFRETEPTLHRNSILKGLREYLAGEPALQGLEARPTGVFLLYSNMLNSLIDSQKDTFAMVLVSIWVMLLVLFIEVPGRSSALSKGLTVACFALVAAGIAAWLYPREGWRTVIVLTSSRWVYLWLGASLVLLVGIALALKSRGSCAGRWLGETLGLPTLVLVPQVLPVFFCLGTMGFTGIPLDLITVMIASIAMGVGIDAAIQYTVRYRIELAAVAGDHRSAITRSHATIGRSIWIATSIVVAGFIVLVFSKFVPTVYFGIFTALAMLMGQFAALTLLPSLFLLFRLPRFRPPESD